MQPFSMDVQVRWSDLDPNFHLRHSVYYDWGALCRVAFLNRHNLDGRMMTELQIGPILFREECIFRKEIRSTDAVSINLQLLKARPDFSRWSIQHHIVKNGDVLSAVLTVDGAWMNTSLRKLATPPEMVKSTFETMPRSDSFEWLG